MGSDGLMLLSERKKPFIQLGISPFLSLLHMRYITPSYKTRSLKIVAKVYIFGCGDDFICPESSRLFILSIPDMDELFALLCIKFRARLLLLGR